MRITPESDSESDSESNRYVIYHKVTTIFLATACAGVKREYKSPAAAKAAITRAARDHGIDPSAYALAEAVDFYRNIEKQETMSNLMTGAQFQQGVNTPIYCDPSSETYWSL